MRIYRLSLLARGKIILTRAKSCFAIGLLLICCFLFAACSTQNRVSTPERLTTAEIAAIANTNMASLLQDSLRTNNSQDIARKVRTVIKNVNEPESIFSLAVTHNQNASQTKNAHERDLAITYFEKVLELVPGNQVVIGELYTIYYDDVYHNRYPNAFNKAKENFLQLSESTRSSMNPPSLAKFVATALSQDANKEPDHQRLREILLDAILEQPKNDNAYIQLAKLFSEDRYFSLAIATLKRGEENIKDSVELYKALGSAYEKRASLYGCNYENPKDIANSAQFYKLAVALNPKDQGLHYALANSLFDQNMNYLGLNEMAILVELNASVSNLTLSAEHYSMLGKHKKANKLLSQIADAKLDSTDASLHEISMNQGNWQKAASEFSTYMGSRKTYSVYDLIKSDLITQQLAKQKPNQEPPSLLKAQQEIVFDNIWEKSLHSYWANRISSDELKKSALNRCEKTEYFFYTGYKDYMLGLKPQANKKFLAAIDQNTYRFIERPLARYFLEQ
jgi:tetratricopeptide (TPR) repeat protein